MQSGLGMGLNPALNASLNSSMQGGGGPGAMHMGMGTASSPRRAGPIANDMLVDDPGQAGRDTSSKGMVVVKGLGWFGGHWVCCLGTSLLALVLSLFLYLLYSELAVGAG